MTEPLVGQYTYDYNIESVHQYIKKYFKTRLAGLRDKKLELAELERKLSNNNLINSTNVRAALEDKIEKLRAEIDNISSNKDVKSYMNQSAHLLKQYHNLGTLKYNCLTNEPNDTLERLAERKRIIADYLQVVKQFMNINIICKEKYVNECIYCKQDITQLSPDCNGLISCSCNIYYPSLNIQSNKEKRAITSSSDYLSIRNMKLAIRNFQCQQSEENRPPPEVYSDLRIYILNNVPGRPDCDIIKNKPLNKDGEKDGVTHEDLINALQNTGNTKYYKDINLIRHELLGIPKPDISYLEQKILADFEKSEPIYNDIKHLWNRSSSMNTQYRLLFHLNRLKYPCNPNTFKLPETPKIVQELKEIWAMMCERLGWDNEEVIETVYSVTNHVRHIPIPVAHNVEEKNIPFSWPDLQYNCDIQNDEA